MKAILWFFSRGCFRQRWLWADRSTYVSVLSPQDYDEPSHQRTANGLGEFLGPMLPVNLLDYEQVCWVNVEALRAAKVGQVAAIRVLSDDVVGNLCDAHHATQRPAARFVGVNAEIVESPPHGVGSAVERLR